MEKTLRLESAARFPLFHRYYDYEVNKNFYRGLLRTKLGMRQQSNGVPENLIVLLVVSDRSP